MEKSYNMGSNYPLIKNNKDEYIIQGNKFATKYDDKENLLTENDRIKIFLQQICSFSYRKGFELKIHKKNVTVKFDSDTGWGCMLRSGQMMFFEIIKLIMDKSEIKHFKQYLNLFDDIEEGELAPFGIQNIVKTAYKNYEQNPGEWFRSTTVIMTLDDLNKKYKQLDLEIINFKDAFFSLEEIHEVVIGDSTDILDNTIAKDGEILEELLNKKWKHENLLLSLTNRIGYKEPNTIYEKFFKDLLDLRNCVGVLGGEGSRAYYIIGSDNHNPVNYFYLDPHHTQGVHKFKSYNGENYEKIKDLSSYFSNKKLSNFTYKSLNCSIQYGFVIKGNKDFGNFWESFQKICQNTKADDMFLSWREFKISDNFDYDDVIAFD